MALFILQPDADGNCCECNGRTEPCDSCEEPPAECSCALLIPDVPFGGSSPYASYADAQTAIATYVSNCVGYLAPYSNDPVSFSLVATESPGTLVLDSDVEWSEVGEVYSSTFLWCSLTLASGELTIAWTSAWSNSSFGSIGYRLYGCDGTFITIGLAGRGTTGSGSGSGSFPVTIDAEGTYYLQLFYANGGALPATEGSVFTIAHDNIMVVNPVIAVWDDSGTTQQLEACPKFELPPGSNFNQPWYATLADAQNIIDNYVGDCKIYNEGHIQAPPIPVSTLISPTNYKTEMESGILEDLGPDGIVYSVRFSNYVEVYLEAGAVLNYSVTFYSQMAVNCDVAFFFNYNTEGFGQFVQGMDLPRNFTGSFNPVPVAGKYRIQTSFQDRGARYLPEDPYSPWTSGANISFSSSGSPSLVKVQALYDINIDCPARLDCS